jgi:hypothetical protein
LAELTGLAPGTAGAPFSIRSRNGAEVPAGMVKVSVTVTGDPVLRV